MDAAPVCDFGDEDKMAKMGDERIECVYFQLTDTKQGRGRGSRVGWGVCWHGSWWGCTVPLEAGSQPLGGGFGRVKTLIFSSARCEVSQRG